MSHFFSLYLQSIIALTLVSSHAPSRCSGDRNAHGPPTCDSPFKAARRPTQGGKKTSGGGSCLIKKNTKTKFQNSFFFSACGLCCGTTRETFFV
uniref:Putative secreted protein n=1 Tax=Ixodes ricinus TaxID=34613 RepID=A0A6B0UCB3_IXORI